MKFDGRAFAQTLENDITSQIVRMERVPKVVSILVGSDPASELYTRLKKSAAERVGILFEVVHLPASITRESLVDEIVRRGADSTVTGLMIQLPLPGENRKHQKEIISNIPINKDIDGLRWEESGMMPATVRAVLAVMGEISVGRDAVVTVVGSEGSVGRPLVHFLRREGYTAVSGTDIGTPDQDHLIKNAHVVISCVGKPGLIDRADIQPGCILIDVGISQVDGHVSGDMTQEAYDVASVSVEVPGGIGPVTIACLMMNTVEVFDRQKRLIS